MPIQPEHRSILAVDVEGFARLDRTDPIRLRVHKRLRRLLTNALLQAGADQRHYKFHDTGDGFLATIGPAVPKSRLLDPLIPWLADRLDRSNHRAGQAERIRLRVVVHAGEVLRDPDPNVGHTVIFASRLLDAQALRICLATTSAPLVLMVSDWIYREVVQHHYGTIDPASYQPVRATSKETDVVAWVHVPGDPGAVQRAGLVAAATTRPPYPGLEAFTEEDAGVFFAREPETAMLLDRLHPALPREAHRFVAVIGPSGSGKSSLVQAGLLPQLAKRRSRWVIVPPLVPEDRPIRNLARSLAAVLPGRQVDALAAELAGGAEALVSCCEDLRASLGGRSVSVLLVVDQAEELLTLTGEQDRAVFLTLLREALREDPGVWVVATLRSEFLTGFLTTRFATLFRSPMVVGVLARTSLFEVIEKPAAHAGLSLDPPGLVHTMVEDTGGGDALPLLAYTLQALYLRAGPAGRVTAEQYRRLGGVAGALARQADSVTAQLRARDKEASVLGTLLRFVTLDGSEPTRRRVRRSTLSGSEREIVDAFIAARLLTSDAEGDDALVEVTHEALFRHWAPLRQMIQARADELRQRADLERWAQDWVRSGRRDAYLLRDERLTTAQQWASALGNVAVELPVVGEFLARSRHFDRAAMVRLSEAVARRALASIEHDPEQSLLLALAAVEECAPTALAHRALLAALAASRIRSILRGHAGAVRDVAWSPDGQRIATASYDGTARVWDAERSIELAVLRGHQDVVLGVAWSPDGQRVATGSHDRTIRIWDATNGTELAAFRGHEDYVVGVAWAPLGQRIASVSRDRTVRVWDAETAAELAILRGHEDRVRAVAWAPDGHRIATTAADRTVRVWDAETAAELAILRGHEDWVEGMAWAPDGQRLASASLDRTARVWAAANGQELVVLRGHQDRVQGVAWSPDGHRLATASSDRTARIWAADTGSELVVLRGHEDGVRGVAWRPDGRRVATASYDRTARVWDADTGAELAVVRVHPEWLHGLAWSPDGRRLATTSSHRAVRVWDPDTSIELAVLRGHETGVDGVAWSPDGWRLATASRDRTARVWDVDGGVELAVLCGHEDWVRSVVWSPDGRHLATASGDRTARVWDVATGNQVAVLVGHEGWIESVAWSPDGQHVVTASRDRTARIWRVETGAELTIPGVHEDWIESVAWSPDGRRIATASRDRTARVWEAATDLNALVRRARQRILRELTDEERRSVMLPR